MLTKEEQNMLLDDIKSGKTDAINKLARIALSVATQTLYRKFKIVDKVKVNDIVSKVVSKIDTFKPQYKLIN
jgi:hypothetical protein